MKILLTNYSLGWRGGTQTWVHTVKEELEKRGYEVYLFAGDDNYSLFGDYKKIDPSLEYDLALVNHNSCLSALDGLNIKKKIFTSHGIIPELEQPDDGADAYVSVSEEVQDNLMSKGYSSSVIRNPIDTEKWALTEVNQVLKNVVYMSNYQGGVLEVIQEACNGLNLSVYGKNKQVDGYEALSKADLVIGLGRTCYEAMSMGKNVIVFDYNGADGFITPETVLEYRQNNCSGRKNNIKLDVDGLKELLGAYDPNLGVELRNYIIENNDVKVIVDQYLELWKILPEN